MTLAFAVELTDLVRVIMANKNTLIAFVTLMSSILSVMSPDKETKEKDVGKKVITSEELRLTPCLYRLP